MNKLMVAMSALLLATGVSVSIAADETGAAQPGAPSNVSPTAPSNAAPGAPSDAADPTGVNSNAPANSTMKTNPFVGGTQAPPAGWTSLKGMVESVDKEAKVIQLKDEAGQVLRIPIDKQVKIERDGKAMSLTQLKTGDSISLSQKTSETKDIESRTY